MKVQFSELNPIRVGLVGLVVAATVMIAALNLGTIVNWLMSSTYVGAFTDAGGLRPGDDVRIAGVEVGSVKSISLGDGVVNVAFTVRDSAELGDRTRLAIKSQDVLGRMYIEASPDGTHPQGDAVIPVVRTTTPYDLNQALADLTTHTAALDTQQLAKSLNVVASALHDTPRSFRATVSGVERLSTVIAQHDTGLRDLLGRLNRVSGVVDDRKSQLVHLFGVGNVLLSHLNEHQRVITELFKEVTDLADELSGVIDDNNAQMGPVLRDLRRTADLLDKNAKNINATIHSLARYGTQLGDSIGSGPYFQGYVENLAPTNLAPVLSSLAKAHK